MLYFNNENQEIDLDLAIKLMLCQLVLLQLFSGIQVNRGIIFTNLRIMEETTQHMQENKYFQDFFLCHYRRTGVLLRPTLLYSANYSPPGGGHCPLARDSEPIRLLERQMSLFLYMLIHFAQILCTTTLPLAVRSTPRYWKTCRHRCR